MRSSPLMEFLKPVNQFVSSLSHKEFQKYFGAYLAAVLLILGFMFYRHYSKISKLRKSIGYANSLRINARDILTKDEEVKRQKNIVDKVLEKRNKSFKLLQVFIQIINKLRLQSNLKKRDAFVSNLEHLRSRGYSEVRVEANLTNLNTKQLVELLDEIEKNTIIYTKYLEINRSGKAPVVDVILTIATLQSQANEVVG